MYLSVTTDTAKAEITVDKFKPCGLKKDNIFTARCTIVQSAELRSHVVRLSVRLSVCDVGESGPHRLENLETNFTDN